MVTFNIEKKDLFLISAIVIFIIGISYVIATGGTPTTNGHSYSELQTCSESQILKVVGGVWTCADNSGGGGGGSSHSCQIQRGTSQTNNNDCYAVTFPTAFLSIPTIVATPEEPYAVGIKDITTTGFKACGNLQNSLYNYNWVAYSPECFTGSASQAIGVYVKDNNDPVSYDVSNLRYHVSISDPLYKGKTKALNMTIINDLCSDFDGCQIRLGMTKWDTPSRTETASVNFLFYYNNTDGHWRVNSPYDVPDANHAGSGIDGQSSVQHAINLYWECYFTDGEYNCPNYSPPDPSSCYSDTVRGMNLLIWNGNGIGASVGRTCELTIDD